MKLHEKLKYAREKYGKTCFEVSQFTGIRYSDILWFERGRKKPTFYQLHLLAELYRRDLYFFLNEDEPKEALFLRCK